MHITLYTVVASLPPARATEIFVDNDNKIRRKGQSEVWFFFDLFFFVCLFFYDDDRLGKIKVISFHSDALY